MYKTTLKEIVGISNKSEFCTVPVGAMARNVISWENKSVFDYSVDGGFTWTTIKTIQPPTLSDFCLPKIKQSSFFKTII